MLHISGIRKYFTNTAWLVAERIFRLGISFFVAVHVARYLGPEKLGLLTYAQSYVGLFGAFTQLGLDAIVVRELVKFPDRKDIILGTSFILRLLGIILVWLMIILTVPLTNNDMFTNVLIAIIAGGLIFRSFNIIDFYFQANVISKYSVLARTVAGVITPFLNIILILINADLIWFALVIVGDGILTAIILVIVSKYKHLSIKKWQFDSQMAKNLLNNSWPLIFAGLMITIYMKIDQIMLKNIMDATQVGIYAVAVRISEFWYFIPMLVTQSLFPAIIKSQELGKNHFDDRMQHLYDLMTFISLSIAILMTFSSGFIMGNLFGIDYTGSEKVLAIHIWAGVIVFYGVSRGRWIIAQNLQRKAIIVHVTGVVLNIVLNTYLIPMYGAKGAALATLGSYSLNSMITGIGIKEFRPQHKLFLLSFLHFVTFRTLRSMYLRRIK